MLERENIIADLLSRLRAITGVAIVTRNWRKHSQLKALPAIFVRDRGDEVTEDSGRPIPNLKRDWTISLVTILAGTTEETAPAELATFQGLVRAAVYQDARRLIGTDGQKAKIIESAASGIVFPDMGNNTVAQEIEYHVYYVENVAKLFL